MFAQYLKHSKNPKYSVKQINTYPTATNGVQVVATLFYAWTSDSLFKGRRWPPILIGGSINIISSVSLAIWDIPVGWKWTCFIIAGAGGGLSGILFAYVAPYLCHIVPSSIFPRPPNPNPLDTYTREVHC